MHNNQTASSPPTNQLKQNMQKVTRNGQALGYLDAMNEVAKVPTVTGHPLEIETIGRVYSALQRGYSERFKRGLP